MSEIARAFCWGIGLFLALVCIVGLVAAVMIVMYNMN